MKKTLFTIALAAAMTPFTFAAQAPKPAENAPAKTTTTKKAVKKHAKKHAKSSKPAAAPTK